MITDYVIAFPQSSGKCKVTDSDRIKTSGSLEMGGVGTGGSEGIRWTRKKPWEVMQVFSTSSVVMVRRCIKRSKVTKLFSYSMCSLLCVNHISIKLLVNLQVEL